MIDFFSESFVEARRRFQAAAALAGAKVHSYPLNAKSHDNLAIEVAILGCDNDPAVIVSSGIHGVEGFFGSAVQLALLQRLQQRKSKLRYVLIHALNPFGFSQLRRFNEDNVDLNRNFPTSTSGYTGAPDGYAELDGLLNPESPPSRFEPFTLKAIWQILRSGLQPLKAAVAGGQYEYPRGLFFGGSRPCQSTQIVKDHCAAWLAASPQVMHVDLHSGLGRFGAYKLLVNESSESVDWYRQVFGPRCVEPLVQFGGTAYPASGLFGEWMQSRFHDRRYRFATVEFGTFGVIRVLAAIRAENRAHHYGSPGSPLYRRAKQELLECFCPSAPSWRRAVVESGLAIIDQACQVLAANEGNAGVARKRG